MRFDEQAAVRGQGLVTQVVQQARGVVFLGGPVGSHEGLRGRVAGGGPGVPCCDRIVRRRGGSHQDEAWRSRGRLGPRSIFDHLYKSHVWSGARRSGRELLSIA